MTSLAVVVPCYNEHEVLCETAARLATLLGEYAAEGLISPESRICVRPTWFANRGA